MNRVFVTGASGFVGSAVVRALVAQGREVAVLLRASSSPQRLQDCLDRLRIVRADLQGVEAVSRDIADFAPDAVLHLGWEGVKGAERNSPVQASNIASSLALFRIAAECGCQAFVGMGSQAEYGPAPGKLDESAPTRPTTVYGAAKLSTCLMLDRLGAANGQPFAWLRLFSSYGPGDDPSWLLQYLARMLLSGQRPALTAAQQVWDYIHVDDVAGAVIAAMDSRAQGVFNLGSGQAHKLEHIITTLRDLVDPGLPLGFGEVPYRPDQVMHLEADIGRLTAATGWRPQVPLDTGLRQVVDWLREHA
jgi:UDP-glucose 4-epimerase